MSPLLSDIVCNVLAQSIGLDVIAQIDDRDSLLHQLPQLAPDIVVIGLRPGEHDEIGRPALRSVPAAKVIVISSDWHHAYVHEMRLHRSVLHDFTPGRLLSAIIE